MTLMNDRCRSIPKTWMDADQHFKAAIVEPWYQTIAKIYSQVVYISTSFFAKRDFQAALMPVTCTSVSSPMGLGSDSLPVDVNLFGQKTYLADSMQFQLEYLMRVHQNNVWYIMPTFRGEDPDARHLNQFFHAEAEIKGTLSDVMTLIDDYIATLVKTIYSCSELMDAIEKIVGHVDHMESFLKLKGVIPHITSLEAEKLLKNKSDSFEEVLPGVKMITSQGERYLMEHFSGPVWLTHMPALGVPFYQAQTKDGKALCADLLMGIGETVGCGQRHANAIDTLRALKKHQVRPEDYAWYIRMKQEFPMQTSGFGIGIERFLAWVLQHDDVRDLHIFSRLKGFVAAP